MLRGKADMIIFTFFYPGNFSGKETLCSCIIHLWPNNWVIVLDKLLLSSYRNGNLNLRESMAGLEELAKSQAASGRRGLVEIE